MSRLHRYLLASTSHLAIHRAWAAQAHAKRNHGASPDAAATTTPSLVDHDEPEAALAAVAAARGAE